MPESVLFKHVLPGHEPSDEVLLKMLEDRAAVVAGCLDRTTLPKLGEVRFMPNIKGAPTVCLFNRKADAVTYPLDGLSTQGMFVQVWAKEDDGAKYHLVGFSRDGAWLQVVVEEELAALSASFISKVRIFSLSPDEIVRKYLLTYRDLLDFLSRHMQKFADASRERHQRLQGVADRFVQEDMIVQAMCAKPEDFRK